MDDIIHKSPTHRKAIAQAIVKLGSEDTIRAIKGKKNSGGDVFEMAKAAGLFAAKKTAEMIPTRYHLPIEYCAISYDIRGLEVYVFVEIQTIYKSGVEIEAMHAASVVALTIYDMLKSIDNTISIEQIKLIEQKGSEKDFSKGVARKLKAVVIVCSDTIAAGKKEDRAGKIIIRKLEKLNVEITTYQIIPDNKEDIQTKLTHYVEEKIDMVIFSGGTGLSPKDVTPEAIKPLIEREVPGIEEAIRNYGQQRTPYSMLSRSVSGLIGSTLVLALPGSTKGAEESMDAIFPAVLHIFMVLDVAKHRQ